MAPVRSQLVWVLRVAVGQEPPALIQRVLVPVLPPVGAGRAEACLVAAFPVAEAASDARSAAGLAQEARVRVVVGDPAHLQ